MTGSMSVQGHNFVLTSTPLLMRQLRYIGYRNGVDE